MFSTILIANRGEIACRVMRTARRLGIETVAVFSAADAQARHVALADRAEAIGPAPARESYLNVDAILAAARRSGAQAIHPGYGFLSENADFAQTCAESGLVFIGPPPAAIRAMGSKAESKRLMERAGVPLVPGYHGDDQSPGALREAAMRIGWPVLVKASAGGGGKGMRVVRDAAGFDEAVTGARREAKAAFGDDRLLLEKYLAAPRHVEVQVFADSHGHTIHLFDRDCSLQRRHQKVIEEAPAPGLPDRIRAEMGAAAAAAAKSIGYVGAGTVEFLYQDGAFHFIEMNTRLQVEHPVTEMITGLDLVEWQLRVAFGETLPLGQDRVARHGHAFEARLYAEDPARDFLPASGRLVHFATPPEDRHLRVETGVRSGDEVSIHYDPMIAKLVVWDEDRPAALRRLRRALAATELVGPASNCAFLAAVAAHPDFAETAVDTGFLDRARAELVPPPSPAPAEVLAVAAIEAMLRRQDEAMVAAGRSGDPSSPWHRTDGWRLNDDNHHDLSFRDGDRLVPVVVHFRAHVWELELSGGRVAASGRLLPDGGLEVEIDGARRRVRVVRAGAGRTVLMDGQAWTLVLDDPTLRAAEQEGGSGLLTAPMPGKVVAVLVAAGTRVARGAALMVLEAMKMEHTIKAPADGTVVELRFAAGDQVGDGDELLVFEAG